MLKENVAGVEPMKTELDKFYGLIDEIKVARLTTRRPDGHLESRAMANQKRAGGADLCSSRPRARASCAISNTIPM